jgi:protoporphyrinogen oxidase
LEGQRASTGAAGRAQRGSIRADRNSFYDIVILGAGPCGLGAAWEMEQQRRRGNASTYIVIDANPAVGGNAASVTTEEGFLFDYGGHILYPHEEYVDFIKVVNELVDAWHESKPIRGVWIDGRLIPYPVQSNIHRLPPGKFLACLMGLGAASLRQRAGSRRRLPAQNLDSYLQERFGRGLTQHILGPINQKMWAHHPRQLATSWTTQKSGSRVQNVADASVGQILRSLITGQDNLGWSESTKIRYPLHGGTGAIWTAFAKRLPEGAVMSNTRVVEVDSDARRIRLHSGRVISYGNLVSSLPLDAFLNLMTTNPLPNLAGELRLANAAFVGLGLRGPSPAFLDGVHSFHMPGSNVPCWRISFPKSLSPGNVPPGPYWSVLCEISHLHGTAFDLERAERDTVNHLQRSGIMPPGNEVVSRWHSQLRHGYPVPFLGRDELLQGAQRELHARGIFSRGRFGGWKYEVSNQDHTFMQGMEAVRRILYGDTESTYRSEPH